MKQIVMDLFVASVESVFQGKNTATIAMHFKRDTALGCHRQEKGTLTKAHLQRVKYESKHTVGLVQTAIFGHKVLDQTKTTSPPGQERKTSR